MWPPRHVRRYKHGRILGPCCDMGPELLTEFMRRCGIRRARDNNSTGQQYGEKLVRIIQGLQSWASTRVRLSHFRNASLWMARSDARGRLSNRSFADGAQVSQATFGATQALTKCARASACAERSLARDQPCANRGLPAL